METLLTLEQLVFQLPGPRGSDRVELENQASQQEAPTLLLDLSVSGVGGNNSVRLLYDGRPDEAAIFDALFEGRAPLVELLHVGSRRILARGLPSIENAETLTEAYECVTARAITLVTKVLALGMGLAGTGDFMMPDAYPAEHGNSAIRYAVRSTTMMAVRWLYRLCTHSPHWRIGWRFVQGPGMLEFGDLRGPPFRNLQDPGLRFFADPFPVTWRGQTWVFCEDFDHRTQKGSISAIPFSETGPTGPARTVLETPWHLSYPFMIECDGELWMIPESSADQSLRLYRAVDFPTRWAEEAVLMENTDVNDATILHVNGRYWMFATTRDGLGGSSDTLNLFMSDRLTGPWRPHASNPVLIDAAAARPAGKMVLSNGRLYRPVQDCRTGYGRALQIAEVTTLTDQGFSQVIRSRITPGQRWPGRRLHTLNRCESLECIDGSATSFRAFAVPWRSSPLSREVARL